MHLQVRQDAFLEALQKVIGVVERRHTLPILANLRFERIEQRIKCTATDLEIELSTYMEPEFIEGEGKITVSGRKLFDLVKNLKSDQMLDIRWGESNFEVKCKHSQFSLRTLSADEFPCLELGHNLVEFTIDSMMLKQLIEYVDFSIANQDVRHYLNGLLFEVAPHYYRAVSTDGHRLSMATQECETGLSARQCIIPRKAILELGRLLNAEQASLQVSFGENFVAATGVTFVYAARLIEGKYPHYHAVIPQDLDRTLTIEREAFRHALSRSLILSSEKFHGVRMNVAPGLMTLEACSADNDEAKETLAIVYDGPAFDVGFNATYLIDVINQLRGEQVSISFSAGQSSAVFHHAKESWDALYVVMPMLM